MVIGSIHGKITSISLSKALVEVGGLGLIVNSTSSFLGKLKTGETTFFWTHMAVRENDISLYGFETAEELTMFESLISVSGIGPKSALAVLSIAGLKNLEEAVISGNTAILTKIAGIGKKTADKIVLELSGKISTQEISQEIKDDLDVFEALKALGYRDLQIKEVLREIPKEIAGAGERIKQALKIIGSK